MSVGPSTKTVMIHVGRQRRLGVNGPDIDDSLGGDSNRDETDLPFVKLFEPQDLQTEDVSIEGDHPLHIFGV